MGLFYNGNGEESQKKAQTEISLKGAKQN